jgi:predicted metal-dependent phosphoesterase TrpH
MREVTGNVAGRPHIARAMMKLGYVSSVGDAFDRYIAGGRPGFVPRDDVTPEFAINLIHDAGGAAVLAHPFTTGDVERTIDRLSTVDLDGIEVEYGAYDEPKRAQLRGIAAARSLIPTGGSDFHGVGHRDDSPLASGVASIEIVARLFERATRYR